MKKTCFFAVLCSLFFVSAIAGTNDDITNACYTTTKCGARSSLRSLSAAKAALSGSVYGKIFGLPGMVMGGYAGYVLGEKLGGQMSVAYSANEYIYFDDGTCLECDTYQMGEHYECPNGTIISNGSDVYKCYTTITGDSWRTHTLQTCSNSPIKNKNVKNSVATINAAVNKVVKDGVQVFSGDACLYITCAGGNLSPDGTECIAENTSSVSNDADPTTSSKTCREQRTTTNGKACCDTLSLGVYKKDTDTCECKGEMKFVIENGTGYCRPTQQVGAQYTCDATVLAQIAKWKITCAKNSDITALIQQIESYCAGNNKTETIFMTYYNTLLGYNPAQCDNTSTNITVDITAQINNVNNAYSQLTSIHNKFRDDVSVWKNEEGKFNTARLASDSIAGVVLGTTGALVTSHVVKKNQVENGFEDIKCTIGGQNVAEWGDQFRVGIQ